MKKTLLTFLLVLLTSFPAIASNLEDYINTGKSYQAKKDYDTAIKYYQKAITEDSSDPESYYLLGKVYYLIKDYDNAKYYFQKSQSLDSSQYSYIQTILSKIDAEKLKPATPPILTSNIEFTEPTKKGYLNAGDTGELIVKIKNSGKDLAKNLKLKITAENFIANLNFSNEETINELKPNKEIEIKIPIKAEEDIADNEVKLKVEVQEPFYGADADIYKLSFFTRAIRPPELTVTDYGLEEEAGGIIPRGKSVVITAIVKNQGKGISYNTTGQIASNSTDVQILEGGQFDFGELNAGQAKKISFTIFVNKRTTLTELPFEIKMYNKIAKFNKSKTIKLALDKTEQIKERVISVANIEPNMPVRDDNLQVNVDIDINIPETKNINKNGIAIIIGNSNYKDKDIKPVQYAINDAKIVKEYVRKTLGYKEGNIIYQVDADQSTFIDLFGNKEDANGKLASMIQEGKSDVFIYYSGHGAPDENGSAYFVPTNANQERIKLLGYPLETFYNNLNKLKAKSITVVLDSCFSGGEIIKGASPIYLNVKNLSNIGENINVLTSSNNKQLSSWYDEKKHSIFTYYFLKSLQLKNKEDEEGDKPTNRDDGNLSFDDIHKYVSIKVKYMANRLYRREQNPQIFSKNKDKLF